MLQPGDTFERYTIEARIGEGGMGAVYRANDAKLGRRVALKVLAGESANDDARARMLREARAAAALDHPNAVAIFDVGEHEGAPFIVMELVEGKTLRPSIGASVPLAARLGWLVDAAKALASAHRRGLVHRDVKPENVMVRDDGTVKVLDFGIARLARGKVDPTGNTQTPALATLTIEGVKLGTPVYMAPEQIRGDPLDGRADQFAWAVLAYELLAGRLPWRGADDALAVMASILTDPVDTEPLDRAGVPPPVQEVLVRALSKKPDDRFATLDDLLRALEAAGRGEPLEPKKGTTEAQQFSTAEVHDVLSKAVAAQAKKDASSTKLGFEDLLAVAAEVGVDGDSLREASRALRARAEGAIVRAVDGDSAAWLRKQRRGFYRHLGVYAIVNAAILVLGLVLLSFTPWWIWFQPALGWGIGLAIHALQAFTANEDDWRERQERRQRRRELAEQVLGPRAPRQPRVRVAEESGGPERPRVAATPRPSTGDAAALEEAMEAEAAASAGRRRRR